MRVLLVIPMIIFFHCCDNKHLSKKEYNQILDSLRQIEVLLVFDTIKFFNQGGDYQDVDSITTDGIIIKQSSDGNRNFHQRIRHKDSLFWDIFEYEPDGFLKSYYRKYLNSGGDFPARYVIYYDKQGNIESFCDSILTSRRTGNNVPYTIHNIIDKLQNGGVNLLKHDVYIAFTDWTGKREGEQLNDKYYWIVIINYYYSYEDEFKKIKYQHKLRIDPSTGEVLEDWIDPWE